MIEGAIGDAVKARLGDPRRDERLAQTVGLQLQGRIRDHVYTNGQWRDSLLYSILNHEWPREQPAREADRCLPLRDDSA